MKRVLGSNNDTPQARKLKIMRIIQFGVYCWAIRLAFVGVGTALVSVFQFIVPTEHHGLKLQNLHVQSWNNVVNANYKYVRHSLEPIMYKDVGVISQYLLKENFNRIIPIDSIMLKMSNTNNYLYYDDGRLWSKKYVMQRGYSYIRGSEYFSKMNSKEYSTSLFMEDNNIKYIQSKSTNEVCLLESNNENTICSLTDRYLYGIYSNAMKYLPALSPALSQYIALENEIPYVSLWLSITNITAGLHYDLEDNLLLQISGIKKIVLISPEALYLFHSYCSWHPYWRQSSIGKGLFTSQDIINFLTNQTNYNNLYNNEIKTPTSAINNNNSLDHNFLLKNNHNNISMNIIDIINEIRIYEVTLYPGNMIYIPAGYWHVVTTITSSISINTWFSSILSEINTLLVNIPLSFQSSENNNMKLLKLSITLRKLCYLLGVKTEVLGTIMMNRYVDLFDPLNELSIEKSNICMDIIDEILAPGKSTVKVFVYS